MAHKEDDGIVGAEVVLPPLGVVHMWLQFFFFLIGYYCNETENSETKPSKVHIDYVKFAAVNT